MMFSSSHAWVRAPLGLYKKNNNVTIILKNFNNIYNKRNSLSYKFINLINKSLFLYINVGIAATVNLEVI